MAACITGRPNKKILSQRNTKKKLVSWCWQKKFQQQDRGRGRATTEPCACKLNLKCASRGDPTRKSCHRETQRKIQSRGDGKKSFNIEDRAGQQQEEPCISTWQQNYFSHAHHEEINKKFLRREQRKTVSLVAKSSLKKKEDNNNSSRATVHLGGEQLFTVNLSSIVRTKMYLTENEILKMTLTFLLQ